MTRFPVRPLCAAAMILMIGCGGGGKPGAVSMDARGAADGPRATSPGLDALELLPDGASAGTPDAAPQTPGPDTAPGRDGAADARSESRDSGMDASEDPGATLRTQLLALMKSVHPNAPAPTGTVRSTSTAGGLVREELSVPTTATWRAQVTLWKPMNATKRMPVIVGLHNTGGDRELTFPFLRAMAEKGFVAVALSARYYGTGGGADAYADAMVAAFKTPGKDLPYLFDTVWDAMRLIDYLQTRADVDPARIGAIGWSKGGTESFVLAAADVRIVAAVPMIGVQSYKWAIENDAWQARVNALLGAVETAARSEGATVNAAFVRRFFDRVAPGLVDRYDAPDLMPIVAPRALLVLSGKQDPRCPWQGVELAAKAAQTRYAALGASDRLSVVFGPGAHDVTPDFERRATEWLTKWLSP